MHVIECALHHNKSWDSNLVSSPFYAISMYMHLIITYTYLVWVGQWVDLWKIYTAIVVNNIQDY